MKNRKGQSSSRTSRPIMSQTSAKDKLKIRRSVMKFCARMEARRHPQRKFVFAGELLKFVRKECPTAGVQRHDVERWITKCNWIWPARAYRDAREDDDESDDSDPELFTRVNVSIDKKTGTKRIVQLATSASSTKTVCLGSRDKDKDDELTKQRQRADSSSQQLANEPQNQHERPRGTHNRISFGRGLIRKSSKVVVESRRKRGRPRGSFKKRKVQKPKEIRKQGSLKNKVQKPKESRKGGSPRKCRPLKILNGPTELRRSQRKAEANTNWYRSIAANVLNYELLKYPSICAKISNDRDSKLFRKCYVNLTPTPIPRSFYLQEEQQAADTLKGLVDSADDEVTYEFQLRLEDGVLPTGICLASSVSANDFRNGFARQAFDFNYVYSTVQEADDVEVEIIEENVD